MLSTNEDFNLVKAVKEALLYKPNAGNLQANENRTFWGLITMGGMTMVPNCPQLFFSAAAGYTILKAAHTALDYVKVLYENSYRRAGERNKV